MEERAEEGLLTSHLLAIDMYTVVCAYTHTHTHTHTHTLALMQLYVNIIEVFKRFKL